MELNKFYNPYDFANPVSDIHRFFGREKVKSDISYYLEYALHSPRPINLALLGERAAGKTSILNITELDAKARGFCTVRVDLDESDAENAISFFFKIFDAIAHSAFALGAFGGFPGRTYEAYIDIITGFVPTDSTSPLFQPFLFPIHYGRCLRTNNFRVPVSDGALGHDLRKIAGECGKPIIVFFDESNVLSRSRVLLEKLRNTFMNLPGYMLVLAGTPEMFPVIDEVFSPIVRQFKKIEVGPFTDQKETADCIRRPLDDAEIDILVPARTVEEIHELSGGRPYEIQLICHLLFKRVQADKSNSMQLDFRALEDLRKELAESQDLNNRPIISQLAATKKRELECLAVLTRASGTADLSALLTMNELFPAVKAISTEELSTVLHSLCEKRILSNVNGLISFEGDYFDRLYTRYFAREQDVILNVDRRTVRNALAVELATSLLLQTKAAPQRVPVEFSTRLRLFQNALTEPGGDVASVLAGGPAILDDYYFKEVEEQEATSFTVRVFQLRILATTVALACDFEANEDLLELDHFVGELRSRVQRLDGELTQDIFVMPIVGVDRLQASILASNESALRERLAIDHCERGVMHYLDRELGAAQTHVDLSCAYGGPKDFTDVNNLSYMSMALGEWKRADQLTTRALSLARTNQDKLLGTYNRLNYEIYSGDLSAVRKRIQVKDTLFTLSKEEDRMSLLLYPTVKDAEIVFEERQNPSLIETFRCLLNSELVANLLDGDRLG